jgi:uncharacterized protein YggE
MATVSVRGRGVTSVRPDELAVGLTVQALRPRASEAFAEASRLAEQLVALCAELGVEAASEPERVELAAFARSADMPLEAGQQELVAVVDVTFQLEQP